MTLQLQDIDAAVDFPALLRCLLAAYESPPQPLTEVIVPMRGLAPAAAQLSLRRGRLPAGALACIRSDKPLAEGRRRRDGADRRGRHLAHLRRRPVRRARHDGSRLVSRRWLAPICGAGTREYGAAEIPGGPQTALVFYTDLFNIFTHPDYRRRGVGQQIMDWGMRKADELGLEIFLRRHTARPAAVPSKRLHRAGRDGNGASDGFPGRGWMKMAEKVPPFTFFLMWRPVDGKYEEGRTTKPSLA
ncbi:Zinc-binding dehydrogenase [Apiospora arundinis]